MKFLTLIFAALTLTVAANAQTRTPNQIHRDDRPRVFVEESDSWEVRGGGGGIGRRGGIFGGGGTMRGGAKPRTAEIMKRLDKDCDACVVTNNRDKADFVVRIDHEGGEQTFGKDNKLAVFNRDGDLIESGSFSRPNKAIQVACNAIEREFLREQRERDRSESDRDDDESRSPF